MSMYFRIVSGKDGGSGSALMPPGHPTLTHSLYGWGSKSCATRGGLDAATYIGSIEALLADPDGNDSDAWTAREAGPVLRGQVRRMYEQFRDTKANPPSELWLRSVYSYFRNCYAPESGSRNVTDCIITSRLRCACGDESFNRKGLDYHLDARAGEPGHGELPPLVLPAERHLAYLMVAESYPDYPPREDLIADAAPTSGKCAGCEQAVQYEARKDALCVALRGGRWVYDETCPASPDGHRLED